MIARPPESQKTAGPLIEPEIEIYQFLFLSSKACPSELSGTSIFCTRAVGESQGTSGLDDANVSPSTMME